MHRIIFEMETSDPDDFMTLLWLSDHPDVEIYREKGEWGAREAAGTRTRISTKRSSWRCSGDNNTAAASEAAGPGARGEATEGCPR